MPNRYRQGDHICVAYDSPEEQVAVAASYIADGLRNGERGLYVADTSASLDRFVRELTTHGIDVNAALASGALAQSTHQRTYLLDGHFDVRRTLHMVTAALGSALADGFKGLRACGEMSWVTQNARGSGRLMEYESLLNAAIPGTAATCMCQYDRSRLPAAVVTEALLVHPSAVVNQVFERNPFCRH